MGCSVNFHPILQYTTPHTLGRFASPRSPRQMLMIEAGENPGKKAEDDGSEAHSSDHANKRGALTASRRTSEYATFGTWREKVGASASPSSSSTKRL